jgi:ppGpp synthetase/RelA/SpoT-type nucleotidyltranferase
VIPAAFLTSYRLIEPRLTKLLEFIKPRLEVDLSTLHLVSVTGRPKSVESAHQKLQTGKYSNVGELKDLVGITVVVLYRREVQDAIEIVKGSGLGIVLDPPRSISPTDFPYREPKLFVEPPRDYLDRNPDVGGIACEVQFTTAIQHALDMTTHDFDYKGSTYSWDNFRLVAQLRGMLELVDRMIDDIEKVSIPNHEAVDAPAPLLFASGLLAVIENHFDPEALPADRRRLADTTAAWVTAAGLTMQQFDELLTRHADLVNAASLEPTSAVLGALARERVNELLAGFSGRFLISSELESLCPEVSAVPDDRRVQFS